MVVLSCGEVTVTFSEGLFKNGKACFDKILLFFYSISFLRGIDPISCNYLVMAGYLVAPFDARQRIDN